MEIVYYPAPVLTRRATAVDFGRKGLRRLAEGMVEAMCAAHGVGLAAPQVGESLRLFIASETGEPKDALVCVNPQITVSGSPVEMEEGCLSLPGIRAMITRPSHVRLEAFDVAGEPFCLETEGLLARIILHEYDHLEGVLFFHRMTPADQMRIRGDLRAFEEQFQPR